MTALARLCAMDGWDEVVPLISKAAPKVPADVMAHVIAGRGKDAGLRLVLSCSAKIHAHLGGVGTCTVKFNSLEKALMLEPAGPVQWLKFGKGDRRTLRLPALRGMGVETPKLSCACDLVRYRDRPVVLIRLNDGLLGVRR